ncbi:MAG: beta-ketoacyl-ACP synthase III [Phycisphaeraceae bacterium]
MNGSGSSIPPGVCLAGTGMAVPAHVVSNDELAKTVDTSDEWIAKRTGIRQRCIGEPGDTVTSLATDALKQAVTSAGLEPSQLDMVILATMTPEMITPSSSARVAANIGASPAGAVDISAACSGFVYGMNMAAGLMKTGFYKNIGVIGVEMLSKLVNWEDRNTCVLFGDGAGAAVFSTCDDATRGCLYQSMGSDGGRWHELYCPRNEADLPANGHGAPFNGQYNTLQMNGREIYKFAVSTLQRTIDEALTHCNLKPSDLAVIIPHQSNARIIESAREKLGLTPERMCVNIDRYGNTSAASVPIALHELTAEGRVKAGDYVLFVALGGGLTWATSLWKV